MVEADAAERGITIVKWFRLHGYSASHGTQEPALREAITDIQRGDYSTLIVTDLCSPSPFQLKAASRLGLTGARTWTLRLRSCWLSGPLVATSSRSVSRSSGRPISRGRIVTLVAQHADAEKSKTAKRTTYRGIMMIRDNKAHHGPLPAFWTTKGARYAKQARCQNPAAVADIYERVAGGESLANVGRAYDLYPNSVKNVIRFPANHTGVVECSYTHEGQTETWAHEVEPVVDSALWWRANKVLDANMSESRANKGGRPVAWPANWISGILDCPACAGKVFLNAGLTPAKDARTGKPRVPKPRTPKLRCGGPATAPVLRRVQGHRRATGHRRHHRHVRQQPGVAVRVGADLDLGVDVAEGVEQCGGMGVGMGIDSDDPAAPVTGRIDGLACLD